MAGLLKYDAHSLIRFDTENRYMSQVKLEALMLEAIRGDQAAYSELLRESARLIKPYLSKRMLRATDVDDVLQEVLISIHKARHTFDGSRPYRPWLYAIAQYRLHDYLRQHYADALIQSEDFADRENNLSGDVTEPLLNYESIDKLVETLPEKQAAILRLLHHEGCTAKEAAQRLGMGESAVKVAAHRAYKVLRAKLEQA
jgi:RNA polymerase sigma-70 factor (ECF subfamily)